MRYNPNAMMVDGDGGVPNNPRLTPAQMQIATRKLGAGQPLTDAEKIALGVPLSVKAASPYNWDEGRAELDALAAEARTAADAARAAAAEALARAAADKAAADAAAAAAKTEAELAAARAAQEAAAEAARRAAALNAANANLGNNASIKALQDQIAALTKQLSSSATADKTAAETTRRNAIEVLTERFKRYGLGSLVNKIKDLAIDGATEATITLGLQETEEYKTRFKANQARIAKGLAVLNPAEYLNVEDGYRQVLRAYGLKQFDTDDYVSQFIANDVSAAELSNRVVTAVQRVQNADPAISQQLRDYYGIGQADLVAYVLDPNQQFQKIERQVAASEIGVAAGRQGLKAGVSVAEQLAAQGVTQAEAQKGYATIADILPTAEKLSDIYGTTLEGYGQTEAEQEVFNSLASAQRKRQKLTQREIASFSGAAGTNKTSLTTSSVGQYQNPERTYRPRQSNRPRARASLVPRLDTEACELTTNRRVGCYEQQLLG